MLLELQIKERKSYFENEARTLQMIRAAEQKHGRIMRLLARKSADILISLGERLKKKYCPDEDQKNDTLPYLHKDPCQC